MIINWVKRHDADVEFAKQVLLEQGELISMFTIITDDENLLVNGQWENRDEKREFFKLIRYLAAAKNAIGICFMCEAWMLALNRRHNESHAEYMQRANSTQASESETRVEVIGIQTVYRENDERKQLVSMFEIVRDENGKPISTRDANTDADKYKTALEDCLFPRPLSKAAQQLATIMLVAQTRRMGLGMVEIKHKDIQ